MNEREKSEWEEREVWSKLWDYARGSIDFDGELDWDNFYNRGKDIFEIKIKSEE